MANSADPDQLASSEANWSGSTLFAKKGISGFSRTRVNMYSCEITLKKNNLLEDEMKGQIRISISIWIWLNFYLDNIIYMYITINNPCPAE